jgi:hypothetical protein
MKWGWFFLVASFGLVVVFSVPTHAQSLRIQPLEYRSRIATGEPQKGFIDISNPDAVATVVHIDVQAFRQVDDQGTLQFYSNEAVSAGVLPDLTEFELGPKETMRLFFIVNGSKLPSGDVYAVLFATAQVKGDASGVRQTVRAGTLLSIVNGTPGARQASITQLKMPFLQLGEEIDGSYVVKNSADPKKATGFYPEVTISIDPLHAEQKVVSRLVFAGRARFSGI